MKIKWLGHASFLVTTGSGTRIILDPYTTDERLFYGEIKESADVVTISHDHFDHNNARAVRGNPKVIRTSTEYKGIKFRAIPAYHDEQRGARRGAVAIFYIEADGLTLCHLGDLGHTLNAEQLANIGKVDILMVPVGGYYTIDATGATTVCEQLKPKVIIPMHYKTEKTSLPIADVGDFLKGKNVSRLDSSEAEFKPESLPSEVQVVVLKSAL